MNNLQIMGRVLSEVTGRPAEYWRQVIIASFAANGRDIAETDLLVDIPQEEAEEKLAQLLTPESKRGVLRWLVEGAVQARREPERLTRFRMHMHNMQN